MKRGQMRGPNCGQLRGRFASAVAVVVAISLVGFVTSFGIPRVPPAAPGSRTAITSAAANRDVQYLRASVDAVGVGSQTVLVDDPILTEGVDDLAGASFGGEQPQICDWKVTARPLLEDLEELFAYLTSRANQADAVASRRHVTLPDASRWCRRRPQSPRLARFYWRGQGAARTSVGVPEGGVSPTVPDGNRLGGHHGVTQR